MRGTPSDNGIYEEFKKHIQNLDTIHYMRLKVVQGGDNVQDVGINHRAFSSYILTGDIEQHFQDGCGGIYLADVGACESREECSAVSGTMDGTMATHGRKHYAQDKPAPIEKHWKQYYDTDIWNLYDNTTDVLSVDNGQDQQVIIALRKCYTSCEQKTVNTIHFPVGILSNLKSCYSNVAIQLLNSIPSFYQILRSCKCRECLGRGVEKERNERKKMFEQVFTTLRYSTCNCISIKHFNRVMGFSISEEQIDFMEILLGILQFGDMNANDNISSSATFMCSDMKNKIDNDFACTRKQIIRCPGCNESHFGHDIDEDNDVDARFRSSERGLGFVSGESDGV